MRSKDYKALAREALRNNWETAVLVTLLFAVSAAICSVPLVLYFLLIIPVEVGYHCAFKSLVEKGDKALFKNTFTLGFTRWGRVICAEILVAIYLLLWSFLFVFPAVIMACAYAMVPYILIDRPDLSITETLRESRMMMKGHKMELFKLYLSFLGWFLLCIITFGLASFFVSPYLQASRAAFYLKLPGRTSSAAPPSEESSSSAAAPDDEQVKIDGAENAQNSGEGQ